MSRVDKSKIQACKGKGRKNVSGADKVQVIDKLQNTKKNIRDKPQKMQKSEKDKLKKMQIEQMTQAQVQQL